MNSRVKLLLIIAIPVIAVVFAIYSYTRAYIPKYRWDTNYSYKSDQPYGMKLLYDILSTSRSEKDFLLIKKDPGQFLEGKDSTSLYFVAGYNYIISEDNVNKLASFVARGNTAFISNIETEHSIFDLLTDSEHPTLFLEDIEDSLVRVSFNRERPDSTFSFHFQFGKVKALYKWWGIDSVPFNDSLAQYGFQQVTTLNNGHIDCFRATYGKGTFIFHFNPILFTNYYISNETGLRYVNSLLSGYPADKIYWDEYSKVYMPASGGHGSQTPLRFILSERSLRWAWYVMWFFIFLYLFINAKRTQGRIPLILENKNTTTEYLNSLATLHYQAKSFVFIANEMMRQFHTFVKHKYNISPTVDKKEFAQKLVLKSEVSEKIINDIFKHYRQILYNQDPDKQSIIELYKATEYFYKNSK